MGGFGFFHALFMSSIVCLVSIGASDGIASDWSKTEIHLQRGEFDDAYVGTETDTTVITLQHASGWQYGSNFYFVDYISNKNKKDFYAELYSTLSLGKISGSSVSFGRVKDVGLVLGVNAAGDANVLKYLPGISLAWEVPGFVLCNTMFTAYIDDNEGSPVPKEDDSWMIDWAFNYPFAIGEQSFSIEGHVEYIHERDNEAGATVESWVLAQPQLRWDAGKALFSHPEQLFLGIEYQYFRNKLGDPDTDESMVQLLAVWRL